MSLTDRTIRNTKPQEKAFKLSDRDGLYLLVNPGGSKLWRVDYTFLGKRRTLALGRYPATSLADAREARAEVREHLSAGYDPVLKRKEEQRQREAANRTTFKTIGEEYVQRIADSGNTSAWVAKNRSLLNTYVYPQLAGYPIDEITSAQVLDVLKAIERSGKRKTAHRIRSIIGAVFRHAIMTLRANNDPTSALRGALLPHRGTPMAAVTEAREVGELMRAIDAYDGWPTKRLGLLFSALTFARPTEIRFADWSEIDIEGACWSIPKERMKKDRPHLVPLSPQAVVVLNKVRRITGNEGVVFPSMKFKGKPMGGSELRKALIEIGFGKGHMTHHGFRAMASTILNERGFRSEVIEMQLAHVEANQVRRAYNRAQYWDERVELMEKWADLLDEFRRLQ